MMPSYPSVTAPTVAGGKIRLGRGEDYYCCIPQRQKKKQKDNKTTRQKHKKTKIQKDPIVAKGNIRIGEGTTAVAAAYLVPQ